MSVAERIEGLASNARDCNEVQAFSKVRIDSRTQLGIAAFTTDRIGISVRLRIRSQAPIQRTRPRLRVQRRSVD